MLDLIGIVSNGNGQSGHERESTPLLPSNASGERAVGGQQQYYFLGKASNDYQGGTSASVRDSDGGEVVEEIPEGSHTEEFAPKQLPPMVR